MSFNFYNHNLIFTTQITKLRVEHCSRYTNCSGCLESRDPFCGWCSLEKRCTVRSACQRDMSASRWLSLGSGQQCIDFESVLPDRIPINQPTTTVQLIIRTLPELPPNAKYRCVFGNSTPIDAQVLENGLSWVFSYKLGGGKQKYANLSLLSKI